MRCSNIETKFVKQSAWLCTQVWTVCFLIVQFTDLFAEMPRPGDSEVSLSSLSQATTCPPSITPGVNSPQYPFNAERPAGML